MIKRDLTPNNNNNTDKNKNYMGEVENKNVQQK